MDCQAKFSVPLVEGVVKPWRRTGQPEFDSEFEETLSHLLRSRATINRHVGDIRSFVRSRMRGISEGGLGKLR